MALYEPYNDLGKLSNADQRPCILENGGFSVYEIVPTEFTNFETGTFSEISLDTFTTNLMGTASPGQCTGLVYWISYDPLDVPVVIGLSSNEVKVSKDGKLDLKWALSLDPANIVLQSGGNVIYDVDYELLQDSGIFQI